jgi:hypothetical protein
VVECLPGHFEQQPVLRVDHVRLPGGYAEELGVEPGHVGQEAAVAPGGTVLLLVVAPQLAAVGRPFGDGIAALGEQAPQFAG